MSGVDRRTFLRNAGLGATAAGTMWVAPSVLGYDAAFAGASCVKQDTLNWDSYSIGVSFTSATFPVSGSYPAVTVTFTVATVNSPTAVAGNEEVNGGGTYGGQTENFWKFFMNNNSSSDGYDLTVTFSRQVYNLRFSLFDIDRYDDPSNNNGFQDVVWLTGNAFTAVKPGAATVVSGSGSAADPWKGTTNNEVPSNSNNGNVNVTMATVTQFVLHYRSGDLLRAQQSIGIGDLMWCR